MYLKNKSNCKENAISNAVNLSSKNSPIQLKFLTPKKKKKRFKTFLNLLSPYSIPLGWDQSPLVTSNTMELNPRNKLPQLLATQTDFQKPPHQGKKLHRLSVLRFPLMQQWPFMEGKW